MTLSEYQASVLAFLFDRLPIGEEVDSIEFSLDGHNGGKHHVVHAAISGVDDDARIVFTLPASSHSVFLALTRTRPEETARVLANLEDYERESSHRLLLGEVVLTPDPDSDTPGAPFGVLLLRTATSLDCARVPDIQVLGGKETAFLLAVPLSAAESDVGRESGHDVLMEAFARDGKELFF